MCLIQFQSLLVSPSEKEFDELGTLLKTRIEEGNGETIFNVEDNEGGYLVASKNYYQVHSKAVKLIGFLLVQVVACLRKIMRRRSLR